MRRTSNLDAREDDLSRAVEAVRAYIDATPAVALILGSGLGTLAETARETTTVPADAVPGYPTSTVEGHKGRLVFGRLEDTAVVFVQGRVHLYEGYAVPRLTMPVRLVHALGAEQMVVTNSAGGINRTFQPGDLMFIADHLNMADVSLGTGADTAGRVPGELSPSYDPDWMDRAEQVALELGVATRRGVYAWMLGPSYETPAEIRALARLGADAVGMSTVPEVVQARRLGMRVLGLSTITNPAAGIADGALDHDDVLAVGERVRGELADLVRGVVRVS